MADGANLVLYGRIVKTGALVRSLRELVSVRGGRAGTLVSRLVNDLSEHDRFPARIENNHPALGLANMVSGKPDIKAGSA